MGGEAAACSSGLLDMIFWARDMLAVGFKEVTEGEGLCCGIAKASSASFSVTRCPRSRCEGFVGEVASKSNFPPWCSSENWSRLGKRLDISSTEAATGFPSRAANGSAVVPRIGDGLGLGVCF